MRSEIIILELLESNPGPLAPQSTDDGSYAHPVIHHIFPFSQLIDAFSKFAIRNVNFQETSEAERGAFTQPLAERNHRRRRHRRTTPVAAASSFEARPKTEGRRRRQRVRRRTLYQHGHQRRGGQRRRPVRG